MHFNKKFLNLMKYNNFIIFVKITLECIILSVLKKLSQLSLISIDKLLLNNNNQVKSKFFPSFLRKLENEE